MTKNDFILQSMLQLAGNEKYATIKERVDDDLNIVKFPSIDVECIYIDAEVLANEAEKKMDFPFDVPQNSNIEHLKTIASNIEEHLDKLDLIANTLELYLNRR